VNHYAHTDPEPSGQRVTVRSTVTEHVWRGTALRWVLGDPEVDVDGATPRLVRFFPGTWVTIDEKV